MHMDRFLSWVIDSAEFLLPFAVVAALYLSIVLLI